MTSTPITELNFKNIKDGLRNFLKNQDRFKDYNFEGSNLSVLLDVLAYNSFQNNFFTNMALNEMFLDSAELYGSVVSHAKTLNYVPRSKISARAILDVSLDVAGNPTFVTFPAKTKFIAKCGNKTYTFYNENSMMVESRTGEYVARNLTVYEGTYTEEFYKMDLDKNKFRISNKDVDITSLKVFVKESENDSDEVEYTYQTGIINSGESSRIFYIQAKDESHYEIYFGLDIFGKQPPPGSKIRIEYRVTHGKEANGIVNYNLDGTVSGYRGTVKVISPSKGGFDKENIESIKYFAPKSIQVQDRAITEFDYGILMRNNFPEIEAISVIGGDEVSPPRYGKVIIAVDVKNAEGLSSNDKKKYIDFLKTRVPIGIEPIIVDPEFMFMNIMVNVYFDTSLSSDNSADIQKIVADAINNYSEKNLNDFKITFRPSNILTTIDKSHPAIVSSDLIAIPIIPINPTLASGDTYVHSLDFKNELSYDHEFIPGEDLANHRAAIKSSSFTDDNEYGFIMDDGNGTLNFYKTYQNSAVIARQNVGSVSYYDGKVKLSNFIVKNYSGPEIKIYGRTASPTIETPKNRILAIRKEDVIVNVIGIDNA